MRSASINTARCDVSLEVGSLYLDVIPTSYFVDGSNQVLLESRSFVLQKVEVIFSCLQAVLTAMVS